MKYRLPDALSRRTPAPSPGPQRVVVATDEKVGGVVSLLAMT